MQIRTREHGTLATTPIEPGCKRPENGVIAVAAKGAAIRMTELTQRPASQAFTDGAMPARHADAMGPQDVADHASAFEAVLMQGFASLRFPPDIEARFQADQGSERLRLLRVGTLMTIILSNGLLVTDWLLVPDLIDVALFLRLALFTPLLVLSMALLSRIPAAWREWVGLIKSVLASAIIIHLCTHSQDDLAAAYLVSLSLPLLFNGGVSRTRFWHALLMDVLILMMFAGAVMNLPNPNVPVVTGTALVLVSSAVFTLYGSYWLEHEERTNWLMLQHEHVLLDQLEHGNTRLDQLTRFDALTEVANRRHADDFLEQVWRRARQGCQPVALLMMDIDHFKLYNDHYGHVQGDSCLKDVATSLASHLRKPGDLLARYGGEEFVAVLSDTNLPEALAAAQRVREAVWQLALPHDASPLQRVTLSIGVACLRADQPDSSPAQLLAQADEALYQAKAQGRNRAVGLGQES